MDVRGAKLGDVESIRDVAERAWDVAYDGILPDEVIDETVEDWYSREFVERALSREETVLLVAVEDEEVVGFAHAVSEEGEEGDLLRLYVDPDRWDRGIGTRLFERVREELGNAGIRRLKAMVLAENEIGNAFYRDLGFQREATERTTIDGAEFEENTYAMSI